ncbi:DUF6531 domain-containing protein [Cellulomonas sp. Y8]|uniref:DUF6531 domain-containing protein n=1 Tax=Cellulomonas sp. Y8 TaxID=2591145 RepID=UPI0011CA4488|nr:DUF6531 domain-containing protein [Cellulomonas sp. Y8]
MLARFTTIATTAVLAVTLAAPTATADQPPAGTGGRSSEGSPFVQSVIRAGEQAPVARSADTRAVEAPSLVTITFSEFPSGTYVTNQYREWGIDFGGDDPFITGDGSNPTSPVLSGTPTYQGEIEGYFRTPSGAVRTVDHLQLDVGYIDDPGSVEVTTYGQDGGELLTVAADELGIARIVIDQPGMAAFRVYAVENETAGFAVDNVTFPVDGDVPGITRPVGETFGSAPHFSFAADPVNTATGNFVLPVTDLRMPASPLLTWERTYNALDVRAGALGQGWAVAQLSRLEVADGGGGPVPTRAAAGEVVYVDPAGARWSIVQDGNGWSVPIGLHAELVQLEDGWALTFRDGTSIRYDADGRQIEVHADAEMATYTYDESGRLVTVDAQNGDSLNLRYDEVWADQVAAVATSDGREVLYAYDDAGLLTRTTDAVGAVTEFSHGADGRIATITDPDGYVALSTRYDADGRVDTQELANGNTLRFVYDTENRVTTVVEGDGSEVVYTHDQDGRAVRVEGPDGAAVEREWDDADRLVGGTQRDGTEFSQTVDAAGNVVESTLAGATTRWTYDDLNRVTSETDALANTTTYAYDGDNRQPSTVTDPLGAVTTYELANGVVVASTDPDGYRTALEVDARGLPVASVEPGGARTTWLYDEAGRLLSTTDPMGGVTSTTYDAAGRVLSTTDAVGATTTNTYSAAGRLLSTTDPTGARQEWEYDAAGQVVSTTDRSGRTTTYAYSPQGDLLSVEGPAGESSLEYDAYGRVVASTTSDGTRSETAYDVEGRATSSSTGDAATALQYDARGNVTASTDADGAVTRYGYDLLDREIENVAPDGTTTSTAYDAAGRAVTVTTPDGTTTSIYSPGGRLLSSTASDGGVTVYGYDEAGDQTSVTSPSGRVTRTEHDAVHRPVAVTSPSGLQSRTEYDAVGRVVATVDAAGRRTAQSYDLRGDLVAITAADGGERHFSYTPDGSLATSTDANGATTSYAFDDAGHVQAVTDPLGRTTMYEVDSAGRETAVVDPLGRRTEHRYDARGNRVQTTLPDGTVQDRTFSANDQVLSVEASDGTSVSHTYDEAGRVATSTSSAGTTSYAYENGRLASATQDDGSAVSYQYDAAGRRTSITYPDGGVAQYAYDADGLLTSVVDENGERTQYELDADGSVVRALFPGGVERRYAYVAGELTQYTEVRDGRARTTTIVRDAAGRVASESTGLITRRYTYDKAGQLVAGSGVLGEPIRFSYDAAGNRTSIGRLLLITRLTYDDADQLVRSQTGLLTVRYAYDAQGNMVSTSGAGVAQQVAYDGLGQPVSTTIGAGSAAVRYTASYTGNGLLADLTRTVGRSATSTDYTWSADAVPQLLAQSGPDAADFTYGYDRISASSDGATAVFSVDASGSPLQTAQTRDWVQGVTYDVLGAGIGVPTTAQPTFGYRGELVLGTTVYLRDRSYDATTGRFTTRDPLDGIAGTAGANNGYVYGFNDPVNHVDPLGQRAVSDAAYSLPALGGQAGCTQASGYKRQWGCFQGRNLRTRGYLALPDAIGRDYALASIAWQAYWKSSRPERAAQMFTVRELNDRRLSFWQRVFGGNRAVADGMDWEVGPAGGWRIDIVTDESGIFEVKRWAGGANSAAVRTQLAGYVAGGGALGVAFAPSYELADWANMFYVYQNMVDFTPDQVVVWGDPSTPGAVWFDTADKVSRDVRTKAQLKYNAEELGRFLGIPLPVPLPVTVPVPV